ncbi:MAG: hypothetical protein L7F78_04625 [Syntrophales bacterium LBB04]|nr:hypothetical protein [Syntrophales bacterium LBB04]
MEKCLELLHKIAAPLTFAAGDSYRRLPLIRDMENTIKTLAEKLSYEIARTSSLPGGKSDLTDVVNKFAETFVGFDQLPLDQKASQIEQGLPLIAAMERLFTQASPESPINPAADHQKKAPDLAPGVCFARLSLPIGSLKGVGPKTAHLLERKGLQTIEDLIYFLPRRYEDRRYPVTISQAQIGVRETITGTVTLAEIRYYGKRPVFEVTIVDSTGLLKAKWFKGKPAYLRDIFKAGSCVIFTGETGQYQLLNNGPFR